MLTITTLGGLSISVDDQPIPRAVTAKALALLCYLAVTARPHTREALLALLWSEMDETEAQNNLRQALFQLKKYAEPYLIITRTEVSFDQTQPHWLDVDELARLVREDDGRRTMDDPRRLSSVVAASEPSRQSDASLLSGEFLQGFSVKNAPEFEEWVAGQRARFGETAAQVLLQHTRHHAVAANVPAALDALNRLLARDPWREEAHRDKMRLLARAGQTSAALAQFAACTDSLRRELNIPPSTETHRLAERIARAQQRPPPVLPTDAASFVGRAAERAELSRRLAHDDARLVTVLGPGGMGKTRLALEVLRDLRHAFLEGVVFVSLQAAHSANEVLPALLLGLGLPVSRNPLQSLCDYLREKEMLLALDNFETVLDAAPDLAKLLQAAPAVRLLVTSRQRLNLRWEEVFELSGLQLTRDRSAAMTTSLSDPIPNDISDAEHLFISRARNLLRTFAPSATDTADIQQVCNLLEGVPLAIELASSMMHVLPVATIAATLDQDLGTLISPMHDAPERQRSLRTVFNHSWAVLTDDERITVQRLSIFRGGFSADAAAAVTQTSPRLLEQLADKSFIRRQGEFDDIPRYAMHEVLRVFAQAALDEARETATTRNAQSDYFVGFAATRFVTMTQADQAKVLTEMQRDDANLALAWQWAVETQNEAAQVNMLPAVFRYANITSSHAVWLPRWEMALRETTPQPLRALLQARMGGALNSLGEFDRARECLLAANDALAGSGDSAELAYAKLLLGNGWLAQGQLAEAEAVFVAVLEAEDSYVAGAALANLGIIDQRLGRLAQAIAHYDARLRQARADGDIRNQAVARLNAATAYYDQSSYTETESALREAELLWAQTNDRIGSAMTLGNLGELLMTQNRLDEAEPCFQRALQSFRDVGQRHMISSTLGSLGKLAFLRGRIDDAVSHLHDCLQIAQAIGATGQLAIHRQTLADVHLARNDAVSARSTLLAALSAAGTAGERRQQFECVLRLARLEIRQNRVAQAHRALAALRAEANLPEDICSEVDALAQSLPATIASPIMSLDVLINAVIKSG